MPNTFPKLHNAMWPGLVGKEAGTDHPPISLDRMLELTANASVNGTKFDGVDLFLFHPHTDPDASDDDLRRMADKIASGEFVISAADTIGDEVAIAREGLVTALVGQRPFEMGYKAPSVMIDLIEGKAVEDPVFTGLDECTKDTADTCIQK